jgi:site-specific DNA-methyltransferase (cytosine-N4-specific)
VFTLLQSDALTALRALPAASVHCCVTSPPYWMQRDYGSPGQLGLEPRLDDYLANLLAVFAEVGRVLSPEGTCWVNLGDTINNYLGGARDSDSPSGYADGDRPRFATGHGLLDTRYPRKCHLGIPWRFALGMLERGWLLRAEVIWRKQVNLPERCTDRPGREHETLFLFTRRPDYNCELARLAHGFRGSVWELPCGRDVPGHSATFPELLPALCVTACTDAGQTVLDPFAGTGTTGVVALSLARRALLIELSPKYCAIARRRCHNTTPGLPLTA